MQSNRRSGRAAAVSERFFARRDNRVQCLFWPIVLKNSVFMLAIFIASQSQRNFSDTRGH